MRFNPEEANTLLTEGEITFETMSAEDTLSQSGNEMIKLTLKCWDESGKEGIIFDYLLPRFAWKIKHFCESVGLEDKFLSGTLNATDCRGKCGKAKTRIDKDTTGKYGDKNVIADYLKLDAANQGLSENKKAADDFFDDDIPFG